nr:hypothetical protein [Candidatus Anammoximicrobium sp.]
MRTIAWIFIFLSLVSLAVGQEKSSRGAEAQPQFDGSNTLPNAGFELDENADEQPDAWRSGDWKTGSKVAWDKEVAHSGKAAARIKCATGEQRG